MDPHRTRGARAVGGLAILAGGGLLAGCAPGASLAKPGAGLAERVCGGARQAAAKAFGAPLAAHVVKPTAADLACVLTGSQVTVRIESQAGPRAYAEFDTETSHQSQVFGNGGAHQPDQAPVPVTVPGSTVAVWIPAQLMIVATDSTPDNGGAGAYVTVAVSGGAVRGGAAPAAAAALSVARAAAAATFAAHPEGPA